MNARFKGGDQCHGGGGLTFLGNGVGQVSMGEDNLLMGWSPPHTGQPCLVCRLQCIRTRICIQISLQRGGQGGQDFCRSTRTLHKFYNLQHKFDKNLHLQTIFKSTIYNFSNNSYLQGNIGFEGKGTHMTNALYAGP